MTGVGAPVELGRREQQKVATRAALEEAALRLFRSRGFSATSVADIAAEAGVAGRTFFRYFASKEDVLLGDLRDVPGLLAAALLARPPAEPPLVAIREALFDVGHTPRYALAVLGRSVFEEPAVSARMFQLYALWEHTLTGAVADRVRGLPAADLPPDVDLYAAVTARAALGALRAAAARHYTLRKAAAGEGTAPPSFRELITAGFAVVQAGCAPGAAG